MSDNTDNTNTNDKGAAVTDAHPAGDATHQDELAAAFAATTAATSRADASTAALLEQTRTANPSIPPDLITGSNAEEIAASVTAGQATVDQVIAANPPAAKPGPPGAGGGSPPRGVRVVPDNLRGISKIADALNHPGPGSTE